MPQTLNPNDRTQSIQLSADLFTARANQIDFGSVRAIESVPPDGVYFYEAEILSNELMQIGWATKQCFLDGGEYQNTFVGDDQYSIAFEASYRKFIWHGAMPNHKNPINVPGEWKAGDIIGCLINGPGKNFLFYLNGQEFDVRKLNIKLNFSTFPYYPAASFRSSSVSFNFGQKPFQFPPKHLKFQDFYGYRFNRYFQSLDSRFKSKAIALSCDCFSARSTASLNSSIETIHAVKCVDDKEGVYFYEVNLLTDGFMKIGWVGSQDKQLSIGFDGYRKLIWNDAKQHDIVASTWKVGDILGCLIDVPGQNFIFYHNGKEFDCSKLGLNFGSLDRKQLIKCKPAVSLSGGQHVYCNFGQEPFKFGPKEIEFSDFYGNRYDQALQEI